MPASSPPPSEQVLSALYVQSEHAQNLVDEMAAGSETAADELQTLASQVLERARESGWLGVETWAIVLGERLAAADRGAPPSEAELSWLKRHAARLGPSLASPRALGLGDEDERTLPFADRAEATAGPEPAEAVGLHGLGFTPAPRTGRGLELDLSDLEDSGWPEPEAAEEPTGRVSTPALAPREDSGLDVEVDVDVRWFEMDAMARVEPEPDAEPPEAVVVEVEAPEQPALEEEDDEEDPDVQLAGQLEAELEDQLASIGAVEAELEGEAEAALAAQGEDDALASLDAAFEGLEEPDEEQTQATAAHVPEIVEFMARELDDEARTLDVQAPTPVPGELDEAASRRGEMPTPVPRGEPEPEARPALGRLDLQRVVRQPDRSGEALGPEQFVLVSVAPDPELHLWLGRTLPEGRFELLTARGPVEAEVTCREHQPDLVLVAFEPGSDLPNQTVRRLREGPLTRYARIALVAEQESLPARLAAARLGAVGLVSRAASEREALAAVQLAVQSPLDLPVEDLGETSVDELSDLLVDELRSELKSIRRSVGDVQVPVSGLLGEVLRETSSRLSEGVGHALGGRASEASDETEVSLARLQGKRALVLEADRMRRAALAKEVADLGLEVLQPISDLTKALEAGLAWAPDVLVGGAPEQDALTCARILRRDIALSSLVAVTVRWDGLEGEWPDPKAEAAAQRPRLGRQLSEAFSPIALLEGALAGEGPVSGRVESCGMPALVRMLLGARTEALLEVVEGTDRFEGFVVAGTLVDVSWTEADGTVSRGFEPFVRLLGCRRGRFSVGPLEAASEPSLPGSLQELLGAACHWWRPLALKVDRRLGDIGRLTLADRRTAELKRQSGKPIRHVVKGLAAGKTPAEVVAEGASPNLVAAALRELLRRLAVAKLPLGGSEDEDTVTT